MRINIILSTILSASLALTACQAADDKDKDPARRKEEILKLFVKELVTLTPGKDPYPASFRMGSKNDAPDNEKPDHEVTFKKPFAIAKYEVTQELYEAVMGKNPSRWKGPRNSVDRVTWNEAIEFCAKLTTWLRERKLIGAKEEIRLPTEAEWEYACRAGTNTAYSFGDSDKKLGDYAWFTGNAKGNDPPVGAKKANPWDLYDMHGYQWEWCLDTWHANYKEAPVDGSARQNKDVKERVLRGGSWADAAEKCRSAYRHRLDPDHRSDAIGFRCVRTLEGKDK